MNLNINNWIDFKKQKPEDGEFCFIVFENEGIYDWSIGGYNKKNNYFWCDLGLGGMYMSGDNILFWSSWNNIKIERN